MQRQMLTANHWTEHGVPNGEVKGLKEMKGLQPHRKNNNINPLELPGSKPYQGIHMEGPMAPAAYVAKNNLVRHQW